MKREAQRKGSEQNGTTSQQTGGLPHDRCRATELTALHGIVREVEERQSRIVLLSGEAGIGKSRLVAEIETEAGSNSFLALQGNCFQRDLTSPYAPLLDLLRLYIANKPPEVREAELQPFAQELFPLLPDRVTPSPSSTVLHTSLPEQEKRRLFVALTTILTKQAAGHPLLLVIEDIHWCDESSLEFLQYFIRKRQGRGSTKANTVARLPRPLH